MGKEIIELAIRSPKNGSLLNDFEAAKNAAVRKLVRINGVGPEREFEPFSTVPKKDQKVYVGMTKYASQSKVYRAMMSFGFISKLMKFMKQMDAHIGVFIQPMDDNFDYLNFANKENVTEIALLRPKQGVSKNIFLKERTAFLNRLDSEPEVLKSYTFNVTGGFKGKDAFPHFTIYKDKQSFDTLMKRISKEDFVQNFFNFFDVVLITFNKTLK